MTKAPALQAEPILRADRVFKLYARRTQSMRARLGAMIGGALLGGRPREIGDLIEHEFWAVNDVSFELRRGEALGVIGLNGSGKTTLLRMLAGQILPDRGEIWVGGSSAAMIDLQAGFQPGVSGRSNIFLRAAALGFTRAQTQPRVREIIEFAELAEAIDAPMASYSSGMKMRLAFSVMAMVAPDVLFIDEVLGVGDFRFRQKCLAKIREMRERSAFVFVSHSMGDVARFCNRVIVLHKGIVAFEGEPDPAIAFYQTLEASSEVKPPKARAIIPATVERPDLITELQFEWIGHEGKASVEFVEGGPFGMRISFVLRYSPGNLVVGVPIYNLNGEVIAGFATDAEGGAIPAKAGQRVVVEMTANDIVLNPGCFRVAIGITDGPEFLHMKELPEIRITPRGRKSWGAVSVPFSWRYSLEEEKEGQTERGQAESTEHFQRTSIL